MNRGWSALSVVLLVLVMVAILAPVWWSGGVPATKDTVLTNVPLAVYHSRALRGEESLFWCHYGGCGFPVHAESQGGFFHPWNFITALIVPESMVYQVRWVGAIVIGCLAMFAFLRGRRISGWGALVGAIGYGLGGYWVARLDMLPLLLAAPVLPIGWLVIEWIIRNKWRQGVALGIAAVGWGLLAGHFQLTVISLVGIILYGIGQGLTSHRLIPVLLGLLIIGCLGTGIAAVQLVPTLELASRSNRLAISDSGAGDYSLFPLQIVGMVFPRIFGFQRTVTFNSTEEWNAGDYWGSGVFWEVCPYVGMAIFILALFAIFRRRPDAMLLWIIAGIGLLLAFGKYTPIGVGFQKLPIFNGFRIPARWLLLSSGAMAVLGGMGVDVLGISSKRRKFWGTLILAIAVCLTIGLWVVSSRIGNMGDVLTRIGISGERLEQTLKFAPITLFPWGIDQLVPIVALLCLGITVFLKFPRGVIVTVVALEVLFFTYRALPPKIDYHKLFPLISCARLLPSGRIYSEPLYQSGGNWDRLQAMPANLNWMSGLGRIDVRGSLFDARQAKYLETAKMELKNGGHRLLSLAGVTTIISRNRLYNMILDEVIEGETMVYEVPDRIPLVSFSKQVQCIDPKEDALETLASASSPVGQTMLVEGLKDTEGHVLSCPNMVQNNSNNVDIQHWGQGRITVKTNGDGGMLRIGESYDPGWHARVDRRSTKIFRADYLFMAVQVPAGLHEVVLSYQPPWFVLGIWISVVSLVIFVGLVVLPFKRILLVNGKESNIC